MDLDDELDKSYQSSLEDWSQALEAGQVDNNTHTGRVVKLALALAKKLGLSPQETADLRRGMLVHDIGVMAIPDTILFKPGNYSPEEFAVVKQHVRFGYDMLSPLRSSPGTLDIVRYHHERWDGSGYLEGLRGVEIPLLARVAAIIEVWDGTTSDRPNRVAWSREQARQYLLDQSGKMFDPQIVGVFIAMLDETSG